MLRRAHLLPLEIPIGQNQATSSSECRTKRRFFRHRFGPRIDHPIADGSIFRPGGNQAPLGGNPSQLWECFSWGECARGSERLCSSRDNTERSSSIHYIADAWPLLQPHVRETMATLIDATLRQQPLAVLLRPFLTGLARMHPPKQVDNIPPRVDRITANKQACRQLVQSTVRR
jgi:hypothetical protein